VEDVAGFLAGVDVVAVPSRWEAYGMVANEAREAGRPVLVAPVDGLPEQVQGGGGLVVDFADHGALRRGGRWTARLAAMAAAGALPPGIAPGSARAPGRICWPTCWGRAAPRGLPARPPYAPPYAMPRVHQNK
jgi:glycosyltransferase involved in cell wall biosynthesis